VGKRLNNMVPVPVSTRFLVLQHASFSVRVLIICSFCCHSMFLK
jgi:hypothetical protein